MTPQPIPSLSVPLNQEGILARIDPGMSVTADKGLTINDLLSDTVQLNVPTKDTISRQMTANEVFKTAHIASSARIVIEMKNEQSKNFRCLQGIISLSEAHLAEQMAFIRFAWTNLYPPPLK